MDRHNTPETFHDANLMMMFIKRLRTLDFDFAGNDEAEKKRMALRQVITLLVVVVWASRTGGAGAHFLHGSGNGSSCMRCGNCPLKAMA